MPSGFNKQLLRALLLACVMPAGPVNAHAADTSEAAMAFRAGVSQYEVDRFEAALPEFERAAALEPRNSEYQHWLGKCYGRLAQRANWLDAYLLARKTLEQFQLAVQLDPDNEDALSDLMEYYRRAPGILGGSDKKADAIARRLGEQATAN